MDPAARAIVAECLSHRLANAGRTALESLDYAMRGRQVHADDFGRELSASPPASS